MSKTTLYRWQDDFQAAGEAALSRKDGKSNPLDRRIAELQRKIEKRGQLIGDYTIANRILKKLSGQSH